MAENIAEISGSQSFGFVKLSSFQLSHQENGFLLKMKEKVFNKWAG